MERTYLGAAWVNPNTTEPEYLVDRDDEQRKMLAIFEDYLNQWKAYPSTGLRDARILVTGDRGVGKSILTRAVLKSLGDKNPKTVVPIYVDSRNLRLRQSLVQMAKDLVKRLRPLVEGHRDEVLPLLDQLELLTKGDRVTQAKVNEIATRYGSKAKAGIDAVVKLGSEFIWEQTRHVGTTTGVEADVTEDLLRSALTALLGFMAEQKLPWMVVVFYDNLDQMLADHGDDDVLAVFRRILEIGPCLAIVHIRTEAFVDDLGRDITEKFEVGSLGHTELIEVLERRLMVALPEVQEALALPTNRDALNRLAKCTGNVLTFLRWTFALLRQVSAPFPADWSSNAKLRDIALNALPVQSPDADLVQRLAQVVDRVDRRWVGRDDLERGGREGEPDLEPLSKDEIEDLVRLQVLLPRFRFRPDSDLFLQPTLDLLRPSIRKRLRG